MARRRPPQPRGISLIEMMIALGVLTVGMLAMWHLHVVGITSNAAGRRHTIATGLARELAAGLERLPYADERLSENVTGASVPADGVFGQLVTGDGEILTGAHEWDDEKAVPGVRLESEMHNAAEGYERRWSVLGLVSPRAAAGATAGVKVVAVSVTWRDPPFPRPREVVLYTQIQNPAALMSGLGASP